VPNVIAIASGNIAENVNRLSRVHERYRQTTDRRQTTDDRRTEGRRHIANMNVSSRLLKSGWRFNTLNATYEISRTLSVLSSRDERVD